MYIAFNAITAYVESHPEEVGAIVDEHLSQKLIPAHVLRHLIKTDDLRAIDFFSTLVDEAEGKTEYLWGQYMTLADPSAFAKEIKRSILPQEKVVKRASTKPQGLVYR